MPDFSKKQAVSCTIQTSNLKRIEDLKAQFEGATRSQIMNVIIGLGLDAYEQQKAPR